MSRLARLLGVKKVEGGERDSCRTCTFSSFKDIGCIIYITCTKNESLGARILSVSHPKCNIYVRDDRKVSERIKAWQMMN